MFQIALKAHSLAGMRFKPMASKTRRKLFVFTRRELRTRQVNQIFIDCGQFFIIHSSDRTPRHLFAEFMASGIDAGAHGDDEFRKLPLLDKIEVGSERLPRHAAVKSRPWHSLQSWYDKMYSPN
jgi:hypothetical protein